MQHDGRDPAAAVAALEGAARVVRTPSGAGEMVWRIWGQPDDKRQPVILLHGGSGSWNHWFKTIPALRARYEVIAADLPGLGDSAMPAEPPVPTTVAAAVMEGLRSAILPGRPRPHLVGFSFGGHIAGLTAKGLGDALADLTLVGVAALGLPHRQGRPLAKYRSSMTADEMTEVDRRNLAILMLSDPASADALALQLHSANLRKARFRSAPFAPGDELRRALIEHARRFPGQEKMVYEYFEKTPGAVQQLRAPIFEEKVVDHIAAAAKPAERSSRAWLPTARAQARQRRSVPPCRGQCPPGGRRRAPAPRPLRDRASDTAAVSRAWGPRSTGTRAPTSWAETAG